MHNPASFLNRLPGPNFLTGHCLSAALVFAGVAGGSSAAIADEAAAPGIPPDAIPTIQAANPGAANLNITPRRVIFEGAKRTEAVYVFNQGNAAVTVDVALIDNVMLPTGEIVPVSNVAEKGPEAVAISTKLRSARDLILATPSRLTLPPGKGKTIRLRADIPEAAAGAGEFRTHLKVATLPSADMGLTAEAAAAAERGELVMRVEALFGISIPLIVRTGGAGATAAIGTILLDHDNLPAANDTPARRVPVLTLPIERAGAASVYGNIEVRSGTGKNGELIGLIRGIAVYPEIDHRQVRVLLTREPRHGETVTVSFFTEDSKSGSEMARKSFTAP